MIMLAEVTAVAPTDGHLVVGFGKDVAANRYENVPAAMLARSR